MQQEIGELFLRLPREAEQIDFGHGFLHGLVGGAAYDGEGVGLDASVDSGYFVRHGELLRD